MFHPFITHYPIMPKTNQSTGKYMPHHIARLSTCIFLLMSLDINAEPDMDAMIGLEQYMQDLPIVLSATRLAQPLSEAPVAMTVIDREMIDASGARTIPDLLRLVPGFQVGYFDGNSPVAAYHGHSDENSKRVQVLVDGRSVYVPSIAGIPWQDMLVDIDDIDRIEVTRGPSAATYGNNSFFAVVSIITRSAIEDQGHKIKTVAGSHDTIDTYYRYGGQNGSLDYRITVGTENNDGTDMLNDYTAADYLSYRLDYQMDSNQRLSFQGGFKSLDKGDHEPPPDHEINVSSGFQWIKWENQLSSRHSIAWQYYYNLHDQEEFISTIDIPDYDMGGGIVIDGFALDYTLNIKSERHDLEFTHYYTLNDFRLVSGVSARQDIVTANQVFDEDGTQRNNLYRAFTHGEYRFNQQWLLNAGVMVEDNDISGNDVSPRIALIHHINKDHTIRLSASQATRTPVLWEEHANYRLVQQLTQTGGDPLDPAVQTLLGGTDILVNQYQISSGNLNSEEISSFQIGYIAQFLNNKLQLDVNIFKDKTDQLIDQIQDVTAPDDNYDVLFGGETSPIADDFQNAYQTESEGLELSIDYKPQNDLRIYAHYAYIDITASAFNPDANPAIKRRLEVSAPTNTYGLMLIKHFENNVDIGINYYRVGEMDWMDRTGSTRPYYADRSAQPYDKLDFKISKSQNIGSSRLHYSLTLQNLIEDFYDYNKTRYTDATLSTVAPTGNISSYGSLQDRRAYIELSLLFN